MLVTDEMLDNYDKFINENEKKWPEIRSPEMDALVTTIRTERACNAALREAIEKARKHSDAGYGCIDQRGGMITITADDFYSCCGFPRDILDEALAKDKELRGVK